MQIICPLLLATSWSLTDKDSLNPQSMSFNILYKSLLLIPKALVWFSPLWVTAGWLRAVQGCLKGTEVFAARAAHCPGAAACFSSAVCRSCWLIYCYSLFKVLLLLYIIIIYSLFLLWLTPFHFLVERVVFADTALAAPSSVIAPFLHFCRNMQRWSCWPGRRPWAVLYFVTQPALSGSPFPSRGLGFAFCRVALAGGAASPGGGGRVGSGASVALQVPGQQGNPTWHWCQCEGDCAATMVLWVQESILDEFWEKASRELRALSQHLPLFSLEKSEQTWLSPSVKWVWCCSTPVVVPWQAAVTSPCACLCTEHLWSIFDPVWKLEQNILVVFP